MRRSGTAPTVRRHVVICSLLVASLPVASAYALRPSTAPRLQPQLHPCRHAQAAACAVPEDEGNGPVLAASDGDVGAWVQRNVLQGVELGPGTYAVMTVYFVQGILGLASLARTYFMKDTLGLSPAEMSALMGITTLPWVIKPVYGFLTDGLPIFGYRRKPYLILAGLLGTSSWAALATVVTTPTQAVVASTLASLGVAVSDVVVDSLVVERARDDPSASSGALQSLCWSCQALGGLTSAYFSGSLLQSMPPQQVFGLTAAFPLLVVAMALQLDEKRIVAAPASPALADGSTDATAGSEAASGALGGFSTLVREQGSLLWQAVSQRSVWLPTLFIFLWQATPSSEGAFFYFITDEVLNRSPRTANPSATPVHILATPSLLPSLPALLADPEVDGSKPRVSQLGIGPEFLGRVRVGTSIASLLGIWLYRTYLQAHASPLSDRASSPL